MPPKSKYYDDDDFDDGYDDDEWWEEEEGEEEPVVQPKKPKADAKASSKSPAKPAAAAGASSLARSLVDPPPPRADGRPQPGVKPLPQAAAVKQQPHPLAPPGTCPAAPTVQPFAFDTPSPDDVILAAQQQRSTAARPLLPPTTRAANPATPAAQLATDVTALSLSPAQQPQTTAAPAAAAPAQRRPVSEYRLEPDLQAACDAAAAAEERASGGKPCLHLVVLGHVDAGKSTLMGRLLYDLGLIADKTVHKTQREAAAAGKGSFAWAWMLDERPEERARGVTVDVAVNRFQTPSRQVTLLDAPGHRDFVPNMIAGAAQAEAALLVVDGSPGGFEAGFEPAPPGSPLGGGQTREHAQLARSLGVEQVAVVVTKLDTCDFKESRFQEIRARLEPFLRQCGFKASSLRWLPAVGPTGDNLAAPPVDPRLAAWWKGPTLVQAIDGFEPPHRRVDLPLRLPVSEVGGRGGKGAVGVSGKVEAGALRPGSRVLVMPARELATVKGVEVHGRAAAVARAGDGADITLTGIEPGCVGVGSVLCHPDFPAPVATRFEARIVVLDVAVPLIRGCAVTLHAHAAREAAHISAMTALLDGKTGEVARLRPRCLLSGQSAVVEVTPERTLCVEPYAACRALGRVAVREGGRTVAVGVVTSVQEH